MIETTEIQVLILILTTFILGLVIGNYIAQN